ncbi:MAG: hypothetical protein U9Q66_03590 [Patescibacteria group bacterium]|nr:hypothetical protein [Patescibacteria group bacterium]
MALILDSFNLLSNSDISESFKLLFLVLPFNCLIISFFIFQFFKSFTFKFETSICAISALTIECLSQLEHVISIFIVVHAAQIISIEASVIEVLQFGHL